MVKSWRYLSNGTGYEIQQFRQDENICRVQAGEHGGVYVRQYEAEEEKEGEREMTTITLKNGYYIEIDPLNYTLRQKFKGQTREGQEKDSVRTFGYFGNIRSAITEYLNLIQLEVMHDEVISMHQYVDAVEKSNALALQGIAEELRKFPVK